MNTIFENAVKAAINEKRAPLISPEEAERQGFAVPQNLLRWDEGEFQVPKKSAIGYKVFDRWQIIPSSCGE